jgi:4,5-dihydroxyphthalate decarboxylase
MLAAGDIDAIVTPRPPSCFVNKSAPVDRLFPNYRDAEVGYYGDTGYFPIMHCLTVRKDVAEANPWLPLALLKAFSRAKDLAVRELSMLNVARVTLPWASEHLRTTIASMGKNFWSYGFAANRDELAAMLRFAVKDGLISRTFQPESLFHPSTLEFSEPLGDA